MPITPQEAAEIARKRGLSLSDARALLGMADTPEQAAELADGFVDTETEHEKAQKLADRILGGDR